MLIVCLIIAAIVLIVIVSVVVAKTKGGENYAKDKGNEGEVIVANVLGNTKVGERYVINNLIFADGQGHSCQIDHIYINKFGIWVIETKNYSGMIFANESRREWTQVLAFGNEKHKLYNPVKQNTTHIYRLSKQIKARNVFQNLVVFLDGADIANVRAASVCYIDSLQQRINQDTGIVLSHYQMERYYNKILALKENNIVGEAEHINNVKTMQYNIRAGICPRCGAKLVLRNGKNGKFYGCAKFPKCKFTKNT